MFGRIVSILFKILVAFGTLRVHEIVISTEGRDHVGMTARGRVRERCYGVPTPPGCSGTPASEKMR